MSNDSGQFRHECECRYWLAVTGGAPAAVADVMERIRKKRSQAAADRLREGMREEWKRRQGAEK